MNKIEGNYNGNNIKTAIILSRFNELIGESLLKGAVECLKKHNVDEKNIDVFSVPGAFEIPVAAQKIAEQKKYDAIITLGAVIRGATPHFDYVASNVSSGVMQVSLKYNIPVIFGVLTTDTIEQAIERAGTKAGNKGWDCAMAALEMVDLLKKV